MSSELTTVLSKDACPRKLKLMAPSLMQPPTPRPSAPCSGDAGVGKKKGRLCLSSSLSRSQTPGQGKPPHQLTFFPPWNAAAGPYSQAIRANGQIWCAGQIPADHEGQLVEGSIADKTAACCRNLKAILEAAGSSMDKVVRVGVREPPLFFSLPPSFSFQNKIPQITHIVCWGGDKKHCSLQEPTSLALLFLLRESPDATLNHNFFF
jgi:enamine deaminase RidA (YjgF/YER057c/UK114 family)